MASRRRGQCDSPPALAGTSTSSRNTPMLGCPSTRTCMKVLKLASASIRLRRSAVGSSDPTMETRSEGAWDRPARAAGAHAEQV